MHGPVNVSVDEQFVVSPKLRSSLLISLGVGLILFIAGVVMLAMGVGEHHGHETSEVAGHAEVAGHHAYHWIQRVWSNLWLNSVFFTGISVMGIFFVCVQYVAWAGWSVAVKRIPEAYGSFLPFAAVAVIGTFLVGHHDLFHWTHHELYEKFINGKPNPEYDSIIAGKSGYLNMPFFMTRMILYFVLWYGMWYLIRKQSEQEDKIGGDSFFHRSGYLAAGFLIIWGVTSSTSAWDWVMSIDTHWFSTMFGWYVFASWWVTCLASIALIVILLKENGYLQAVNENHIHDLGKFVFAFSIFWTYIWFSQFLLIFYSNLPEETVYFIDRWKGFDMHYTGLFFFNIIINFFFPFLALMTRDGKRKVEILKVVAIGVIIGHYLDFYNMIMPGTLKENSGFGLLEVGTLVTFASVWALVITNTMSKAKLIPANHPMLQESIHHNI